MQPPGNGETAYLKALQLAKEGGKLEEILEQINSAVEFEPNNTEYRKMRGQLYFDNGKFQQALGDFTRAAEVRNLGQAYCSYLKGLTEGKLGRFDEALGDMGRAKELAPKGDQFHGGLALAHLALRHADLALEDIAQARRLAPRFERWKYVRGIVLACMGRKNDSVKQFMETVVYSDAARDGMGLRNIFFDGEKEYERVKGCSAEQLSSHWHYGGRWLPAGVLELYRR